MGNSFPNKLFPEGADTNSFPILSEHEHSKQVKNQR